VTAIRGTGFTDFTAQGTASANLSWGGHNTVGETWGVLFGEKTPAGHARRFAVTDTISKVTPQADVGRCGKAEGLYVLLGNLS